MLETEKTITGPLNFNLISHLLSASYCVIISNNLPLINKQKQSLADVLQKCLKACNFIKTRLQHRCFPVNISKFLRTAFLTEYLKWLLLNKQKTIYRLSKIYLL